MATYNSYLLGDISGSVGNITACKHRGKNVAKGKIFARKNHWTPAQKVQQARVKALSRWSRTFRAPLMTAFPGRSWSEARMEFISMNQHAVEIDEETLAVTLHPERIACSRGNMLAPSVTVSLREDSRVIVVEHFRQTLSPLAKDNDEVFVTLLDTDKEKSVVYSLGKRMDTGTREYPCPPDWPLTNLHAYSFALSANGKRNSATAYHPVEKSPDR